MVSNPFKKTTKSLNNNTTASSTTPTMQQNSSEKVVERVDEPDTAVGTPTAQSLKSNHSGLEKEEPQQTSAVKEEVDIFPHGSKLVMIIASLLLVNLLCALDQTIVAAAVSFFPSSYKEIKVT